MKIQGILRGASDKSISHRAVIISSIAEGISEIKNCLFSHDLLSTINIFKTLGVKFKKEKSSLFVSGASLRGLKKSSSDNFIILDAKNSGTSIRLCSGILAFQNSNYKLLSDASLSKRPMKRIKTPLELMGAKIKLVDDEFPPIEIYKSTLFSKNISYNLEIASAQVKSAILLASLYSKDSTTIKENLKSRNHTELMLEHFGADINISSSISISGKNKLLANKVFVPSDISSVSFFIVLSLLLENSNLYLKDVGINKTRIGILEILKKSLADIEILNEYKNFSNEEVGDIRVKSSKLKAFTIKKEIVPSLIDEIPILVILALFSEGLSKIEGALELKYKESNRIKVLVEELKKLDFDIEETVDGMLINGNPENLKKTYKDVILNSYNDHRIAMSFYILSLIINKKISILGLESIAISYPNFFSDLKKIIK